MKIKNYLLAIIIIGCIFLTGCNGRGENTHVKDKTNDNNEKINAGYYPNNYNMGVATNGSYTFAAWGKCLFEISEDGQVSLFRYNNIGNSDIDRVLIFNNELIYNCGDDLFFENGVYSTRIDGNDIAVKNNTIYSVGSIFYTENQVEYNNKALEVGEMSKMALPPDVIGNSLNNLYRPVSDGAGVYLTEVDMYGDYKRDIADRFTAHHTNALMVTDEGLFYLNINPKNENGRIITKFDLETNNKKEKKLSGIDVSNTDIINYDNDFIYLKDKTNRKYFKINQDKLKLTQLSVEYTDNRDSGIAMGWLYRLDKDNPLRINLNTGKTEYLGQIFRQEKQNYFSRHKPVADNLPASEINEDIFTPPHIKHNGRWQNVYYSDRSGNAYTGYDWYTHALPDYPDREENLFYSPETKYIYAQEYYSSDSTGYNKMPENTAVIRYIGDWNIAPAKVKYTDYSQDSTRQPRQKWIDYFEKELEKEVGKTDTPIVIKQSWETRWNGINISAVVCTNVADNIDENTPINEDVPPGENLIAYTMSAIFTDTDVMPVGRHFYLQASKQPLSYKNKIFFSAVKPDENLKYGDDGLGFHQFTFYQKDENGDIAAYGFYDKRMTGDSPQNMIQYNSVFAIVDFDNDGKPEVIEEHIGHSSLYSYTTNYEISAGGKIAWKGVDV